MNILKGITKAALSPLNGVAEVVRDVSGNTSDEEQALSILTLGASSLVKGTAKGFLGGIADIFD